MDYFIKHLHRILLFSVSRVTWNKDYHSENNFQSITEILTAKFLLYVSIL
jgi:hypothetical protein